MARGYSQAATDFLKDVDGVGGFSTDADALLEAQAAWFATNSLGDVTNPVIGLTLAQTTFDESSRPGAQKQLLLLTDTAVSPGPGLQLADELKDDDNVKIFCVFYGSSALGILLAPRVTSGDDYFILASSLDDTINKASSLLLSLIIIIITSST